MSGLMMCRDEKSKQQYTGVIRGQRTALKLCDECAKLLRGLQSVRDLERSE